METSNNKPHFSLLINVPIERYGTDEQYFVRDVDASFLADSQKIEDIVRICNQPRVYDSTFRPRFKGTPYSSENALEYMKWAVDGWNNNTYFVFVVTTKEGRIVAALDIKSADLEEAEIGYWADAETPGVMTNAVVALCDIAKTARFKKLYGLVLPQNERSINVLVRAGFAGEGEAVQHETVFKKFGRIL